MNKTQKTQKCREILYKYRINEVITNDSEINFLMSLFENHTEWDLKQGEGINSISVINNYFNSRCFQLNRIDGSYTDISFTHCISNRSKLTDVKKACRTAIRDEIVKYRNENVKYFITRCPITDEILTPKNTHIDHYDLTFEQMFILWVVDKNIDNLISKINETEDNCFSTYFTDKKIIDDFVKFHNSNTKLRAVSKIANLSILK